MNLYRDVTYGGAGENNIYVNGRPHRYFALYPKGVGKMSFLIPKTHYESFVSDLSRGNRITFNNKSGWFDMRIESQSVHEDVWRYDNYFEYVCFGKGEKVDETILRDIKLSSIIDDSFDSFKI